MKVLNVGGNNKAVKALKRAGLSKTYSKIGDLEVHVLAFKGEPTAQARELFDLRG